MIIAPSILIASRVLILLMFATAVVGKLRHRDEFIRVVQNYRLAPLAWAPSIAWLVVGLEIVVVVCLATGLELIAGTALAMILLCAFAVAVAINIARGRTDIDCGCFPSAVRQRLSATLIVRNLLLAAIIAPWLRMVAASPSFLQLLDGMAAGLVVFVLCLVVGQLQAVRTAAANAAKRYA